MTGFNITAVRPANYIHWAAVEELVEYVHDALLRLGHDVVREDNYFADDRINIVFLGHLLDKETVRALKSYRCVIFNSEQMENRDSWVFTRTPYRELLKHHPVWDYTSHHLDFHPTLRKLAIPLGPSPVLLRPHLVRRWGDELLFYGSPTSRRQAIFQELVAHGVPVRAVSGAYGEARDRLMFDSWAVLNLHNSDSTQVFEPVRCFHPLTNGVPVISEPFDIDPEYGTFADAVHVAPLEGFAEHVARLYEDRAGFIADSNDRIDAFLAIDTLPELHQAVEQTLTWFS